MGNCKKCKLYVARGEKTQCKGPCGDTYHKKCANDGKTLSDAGLCHVCSAGSTDSPRNDDARKLSVDLQKTTPLALLEQVNSKLEILFNMKKTLDELVEAVDFYAEKYDELIKNKEITDKKLRALENEDIYNKKYCKALEERISFLEARGKEKNIEIAGLQAEEKENISAKVETLAQNLNLNPKNICEVRRMGSEKSDKNKKNRPRPVIVTLVSVSARNEWLGKKKRRLVNCEVFGGNNESPIYINEDLSKHTRELLWYAKNELKGAYKYIWIQNGKILARKDDSEQNKKIITIRAMEDVDSMKHKG